MVQGPTGRCKVIKLKTNSSYSPQKLRALRKAAGLSQRELAERAELSRVYLGSLETGAKTDPSFGVMCRLADALGVRVDDVRQGSA